RTHFANLCPKHFRRDHRHRRTRSANINRTRYYADRAIRVDIDVGGRLQTAVEPETSGDAAAAVPAGELGSKMVARLQRFDRFDKTDFLERGSGRLRGAFARGLTQGE